MSHIINVSVKNHVAKQTDQTIYVCGNADFVINFDFDSEWDQYDVKTARFTYGGNYVDVVFTGDTCAVPIITNVWRFKVGVFAGDLSTTTPVLISASKSILCDAGAPAAPTDDVYNQIMEVVNESAAKATAEAIAKAESAADKANTAADTVAAIDDTVVSTTAWSSKHILDMVCPEINETGNPVQCYPVKGYPLNVTASWKPTQEGSGDPSPDNIRPITGRDSVTITHNGTAHKLTLPETIYGGSVGSDGKGTNKWKKITVTECRSIDRTGTDALIVSVRHNLTLVNNEGLCDKAINSGDLWYFKQHTWRVGLNGVTLFLVIPLSVLSEATVAGVTAYLTANPYTFVFPTTATFTATGGTELTAVDGVNTVSTDADSVTVKGAEDPKHTIKELQDALASVQEA